MENINEVIGHLDKEIKSKILKKIDIIDKAIQEIHDEYYDHERFFDTTWYAERLGLDNVQSSISYELPYLLNGIIDGPDYQRAHDEDMKYFQELEHRMDCEGLGPNAMARGFSASDPRSVMYVKSHQIMRAIKDINKLITGEWK